MLPSTRSVIYLGLSSRVTRQNTAANAISTAITDRTVLSFFIKTEPSSEPAVDERLGIETDTVHAKHQYD